MGCLSRTRRSGLGSIWGSHSEQSVNLFSAQGNQAEEISVKEVKEYIDFRTSIWVERPLTYVSNLSLTAPSVGDQSSQPSLHCDVPLSSQICR